MINSVKIPIRVLYTYLILIGIKCYQMILMCAQLFS
jgi:hypothetical protein